MGENVDFRGHLHSYALARLMKHIIGYENFEAADHAVHHLLIDDTKGKWHGISFKDQLDYNVKFYKDMGAILAEDKYK